MALHILFASSMHWRKPHWRLFLKVLHFTLAPTFAQALAPGPSVPASRPCATTNFRNTKWGPFCVESFGTRSQYETEHLASELLDRAMFYETAVNDGDSNSTASSTFSLF